VTVISQTLKAYALTEHISLSFISNAVRSERPIGFLDGTTPTNSIQQVVPNVARLAHMVLANIYQYIPQQDAACGCHCLSSLEYLWLIEVGGHADTSPQTPSEVDLQEEKKKKRRRR